MEDGVVDGWVGEDRVVVVGCGRSPRIAALWISLLFATGALCEFWITTTVSRRSMFTREIAMDGHFLVVGVSLNPSIILFAFALDKAHVFQAHVFFNLKPLYYLGRMFYHLIFVSC